MMRATVFLNQPHPHLRVMLERVDLFGVNKVAQMTYDQAQLLLRKSNDQKSFCC